MAQQGPFDYSNIQCYQDTGCCLLDPCRFTLSAFIYAVRSLLPQGPLFNNSISNDAPLFPVAPGVGCETVGCDTLCDGNEITEDSCTSNPQHAQMNLVDAYAFTAFSSITALCDMLKELDPCTANLTVDCWLARYGVEFTDCDEVWGADTKKLLLCLLSKLANNFVLNKRSLDSLASYFGVEARIYTAGDINCPALPGAWTLGRGRGTPIGCAPLDSCDPDSPPAGPFPQTLRLSGNCFQLPSIDIVICRAETVVEPNCLLPDTGGPVSPTSELYAAFEWLLGKLLPAGSDICVYRCDAAPCLE